jgi:hypothetical protein
MAPTAQDIKRFVAFGYATDAFKFARFNCDQLLRIKEENSMEWLSCVTSLVAHYSRPFKRSNDMLPLEVELVPPTHRDLHERLINARDKGHVHLDGNARAGDGGAMVHQVRLVKQKNGRHFWTPARILFVERTEIPTVRTLIEELLARLNEESDLLEKLLLPSISSLRPGLYILSSLVPFFQPDLRNDGIENLGEMGPIN